jgi:hypothetical protein
MVLPVTWNLETIAARDLEPVQDADAFGVLRFRLLALVVDLLDVGSASRREDEASAEASRQLGPLHAHLFSRDEDGAEVHAIVYPGLADAVLARGEPGKRMKRKDLPLQAASSW